MLDAAYLIPAFPLAGFCFLVFFGKRLKGITEVVPGVLATLCAAGAFGATLLTFVGLLNRSSEHGGRIVTKAVFDWLPMIGANISFRVDPLSITMALFVTGIGGLIHLYAIGYMHGDPRFERFFVYLNLFLFSMIILVLGDNLLLTFLGWEGVGACSYLLISFWFEKDSASTAGKKAFLANRVGDVAFMIAMFLLFSKVGSLGYTQILSAAEDGGITKTVGVAASLLLFGAACGKSAQLPLYLWLPDAMEGPTPVSALIHAATMVTAGVFLLCRMSPLLAVAGHLGGSVGTVIAVVGAATALYAALIATAQNDIKRVLAYSTISQLGYMFLAIGSGAYVAALFHMITHAFFKALMFLGAGSVIHGMHDEQDIKKMGNVRKYMPITFATYMVGWLAIAGVPPFSGFWSKDDILLAAYHKSPILWAVGLGTALLTAYYMTRQFILVFFGTERYATDDAAHGAQGDAHAPGGRLPHESPWSMTAPLVVLSVGAAVGGALNLPFHFGDQLGKWLEPALAEGSTDTGLRYPLMAAAIASALLGLAIGRALWWTTADNPNAEVEVFANGMYVDTAVSALMGGPGRVLADGAAMFDTKVIDGAVNGVATGVREGGQQLRKLQTGYVRTYALGLVGGVVLILAYALFAAQVG